ncbi:hypothetical protein Anapl_01197 [Anas platyrhynchos]|uniref:Uncharacterized protein n=1 Tax=Anas platyrhynchos TaxID=8839 RepID=R0K6R6_ANAPL|nr:hypothetical protein Anapl_01197 [Anas platyrhynchos]
MLKIPDPGSRIPLSTFLAGEQHQLPEPVPDLLLSDVVGKVPIACREMSMENWRLTGVVNRFEDTRRAPDGQSHGANQDFAVQEVALDGIPLSFITESGSCKDTEFTQERRFSCMFHGIGTWQTMSLINIMILQCFFLSMFEQAALFRGEELSAQKPTGSRELKESARLPNLGLQGPILHHAKTPRPGTSIQISARSLCRSLCLFSPMQDLGFHCVLSSFPLTEQRKG